MLPASREKKTLVKNERNLQNIWFALNYPISNEKLAYS